MHRLTLVRHGQASYGETDYDRLSPLGERQSQLLGSHWAERGVVFGRVFVGPRTRHRQTHDVVAAEYTRRGLAWPAPVECPGLDEYPAFEVMGVALPAILEKEPETRKVLESADPAVVKRTYFQLFRRITTAWVNGEFETPGIESWTAFRARVGAGLTAMAGEDDAVAFTSGGPVAASIGHVLGLSALKTMELSWAVLNGTFSDILVARDRLTLGSFNASPHLDDPELVTGT